MPTEKTREPQYQLGIQLRDSKGLSSFGLLSNQVWHTDPKRLGFVLARYKFVARMFAGMNHVLEVGCADGFGTRIVQQEVKSILATDFDPIFINDLKQRMDPDWTMDCRVHDMLDGPINESFDGAYALDVLEHIEPAKERVFLDNMFQSLSDRGVMIIGMPTLESQTYASEASRIGHVNCKTSGSLKALMGDYFENVFMFCMNDEILHIGFAPMAHYIFALCSLKKSPAKSHQ